VGSRIFAGSGRVGLPSAAAGGFGRGCRLDRHGAARIVRRVARRAGITKAVGPHTLRHAFITAALEPASRCATCRKPPRTRPAGDTGQFAPQRAPAAAHPAHIRAGPCSRKVAPALLVALWPAQPPHVDVNPRGFS
jgi:hypothetical protein